MKVEYNKMSNTVFQVIKSTGTYPECLCLRRNRKGKLYLVYKNKIFETDLKYPSKKQLKETNYTLKGGKITKDLSLLTSILKYIREFVESWVTNNSYPTLLIKTSQSKGYFYSHDVMSCVTEALLLGEVFNND